MEFVFVSLRAKQSTLEFSISMYLSKFYKGNLKMSIFNLLKQKVWNIVFHRYFNQKKVFIWKCQVHT